VGPATGRALAEVRGTLIPTFDMDSQRTIAKLSAGDDPGRDAIVLLG